MRPGVCAEPTQAMGCVCAQAVLRIRAPIDRGITELRNDPLPQATPSDDGVELLFGGSAQAHRQTTTQLCSALCE